MKFVVITVIVVFILVVNIIIIIFVAVDDVFVLLLEPAVFNMAISITECPKKKKKPEN